MNIEPVIFFLRKTQKRLLEGALNLAQNLATGPFFFRLALLLDDLLQSVFNRFQRPAESIEPIITNDALTRPWRKIQERGVDNALQVPGGPRFFLKMIEFDDRRQDPCSASIQSNLVVGTGIAEIKLQVDITRPIPGRSKIMKQPPGELSRNHDILCPACSIHDRDRYPRLLDPVSELGCEIALDLLTRQGSQTRQQGIDRQVCSLEGDQDTFLLNRKIR